MSNPVVEMSRADRRPRLCCFRHRDDDPDSRCQNPALFYVYSPPWTFDDYTEACGDHVEHLKSTSSDTVEPIGPTS